MDKPKISPDFTIEDIHKIREYHYEITKKIPFAERAAFYHDATKEFRNYIIERKRNKASKSDILTI